MFQCPVASEVQDISGQLEQGLPKSYWGHFPNSLWQKKGDFLGIASVSFSRRTLLLLGHHFIATDGTSITENHTTWVDVGKSVVTVIGAWLISTSQQRKWQPQITNSPFQMTSSLHTGMFFRNSEKELVIMLSLTVIFQGKLDLLRQFNSLLKQWSKQKCRCLIKHGECLSLCLATFVNLFLCLFLRCLSYLWLRCRKRSESQRRRRLLFCSSCFVQLIVFCCIFPSLSPTLFSVGTHLVFKFWSSDETSLTVVVSACLIVVVFFIYSSLLCQYSSNPPTPPFFPIDERICWFIAHHMFDCPFSFSASKSDVFPLLLSLVFPLVLSVFFFCVKIKRSLLSAICCLHSKSFSSGSLPHAASLTAWVKRTDLPCITNVLRGNRLNYAHCGGEDIHNSAIKLLKVRQYLALQLPAVYRGWGMFCTTDMHISCACVGPDTNWGHHSCWPTLHSMRDTRWWFVDSRLTTLPRISKFTHTNSPSRLV